MSDTPPGPGSERPTGAVTWPAGWQPEARAALEPLFGGEERVRLVLGDPATSVHGSVLEGFVFLDGDVPTIVHDRSGRPDVVPWAVLAGPVLQVLLLRPRRAPVTLYAHPGWTPPRR